MNLETVAEYQLNVGLGSELYNMSLPGHEWIVTREVEYREGIRFHDFCIGSVTTAKLPCVQDLHTCSSRFEEVCCTPEMHHAVEFQLR